jgi:hypothetical protein
MLPTSKDVLVYRAYSEYDGCDAISADDVAAGTGWERSHVIALLQALQDDGVGEYRIGRRGQPTRLVLGTSIDSEAGGQAASEFEAPEPLNHDSVTYPIRLEGDRVATLVLPGRLTVADADRIATLLKALALDD